MCKCSCQRASKESSERASTQASEHDQQTEVNRWVALSRLPIRIWCLEIPIHDWLGRRPDYRQNCFANLRKKRSQEGVPGRNPGWPREGVMLFESITYVRFFVEIASFTRAAKGDGIGRDNTTTVKVCALPAQARQQRRESCPNRVKSKRMKMHRLSRGCNPRVHCTAYYDLLVSLM